MVETKFKYLCQVFSTKSKWRMISYASRWNLKKIEKMPFNAHKPNNNCQKIANFFVHSFWGFFFHSYTHLLHYADFSLNFASFFIFSLLLSNNFHYHHNEKFYLNMKLYRNCNNDVISILVMTLLLLWNYFNLNVPMTLCLDKKNLRRLNIVRCWYEKTKELKFKPNFHLVKNK